jgi:hypothetical protein
MMVFEMNIKKCFIINRIIQYLLIFLLVINNGYGNESFRLKWLELVPKYAYDFVPESGVTEEMWEDETFLKNVEKAGLLINDEVVGKKIKIDGFMVPLDFDYGEALTVEEFVLVPDAGMCIHVPPPPPNQMIFVKLKKPEKVRYMYQPIIIEGVLKKTPPVKNVYNSIYEVSAETIKDIDMDDLHY